MTIGDNHRLVDTLLSENGFNVTVNAIPVTGAHENAGLKQLDGETPTEQEVLEAAAYSLARGYAAHDSTNELRTQLNAFAAGVGESDIADILSVIRSRDLNAFKTYADARITNSGLAADLDYIVPGSMPLPIKFKDTFERRNGRSGIRTSAF